MLSRVADSLYWMSRYIERAENNARIAEVNLQMLLDLTNQEEPDPNQQWDPIISSLEENELFTSLYPTPDGQAVIDFRQAILDLFEVFVETELKDLADGGVIEIVTEPA